MLGGRDICEYLCHQIIYIDEDEWESLQENISCSRSEWINEMIKKQNRMVLRL